MIAQIQYMLTQHAYNMYNIRYTLKILVPTIVLYEIFHLEFLIVLKISKYILNVI